MANPEKEIHLSIIVGPPGHPDSAVLTVDWAGDDQAEPICCWKHKNGHRRANTTKGFSIEAGLPDVFRTLHIKGWGVSQHHKVGDPPEVYRVSWEDPVGGTGHRDLTAQPHCP